jgi:hypothetical protein
MEKIKISLLPGLELRPLCRPACSQTLYRLRYPGSMTTDGRTKKLKGIAKKREYDKYIDTQTAQ